MKRLFLIVTGIAMLSANADSKIYKSIDSHGHVTYSSEPNKGAQPAKLAPLTIYTPVKPDHSAEGSQDSSTSETPPTVQSSPLQQEIEREKKALSEARKALDAGQKIRLGGERNYTKYLTRIQGLKDDVSRHEKTLADLQRELVGSGVSK